MAQAPGDIPPIDHGVFLFQLSRARKHLREGQIDLARDELEPARTLRPNDEDVLNLLSLVEFKRGRYSLLGLDPDLVFRAEGDRAAINRAWRSRASCSSWFGCRL